MTDAPKRYDPYPPKVMAELQRLRLHVQHLMSAQRVWDRLAPEERRRLGGDLVAAYDRYGRTVGIWRELRGVSQPRAIIEAAYQVGLTDEATKNWLLREIGELDSTTDDTIATAVASGALVLVERGRAAYWKGDKIGVNWAKHAALWEFFWLLCAQAKIGDGVSHTHFETTENRDYPSKTKHRLCKLTGFPHDLGLLINSAGSGRQKLDLPPPQIRLFKIEAVEILREVTG